MSERDIRAHALVIEEGIKTMANPESEQAAEQAAEVTISSGIALLVGFLVDINRIATAAERISNLKIDVDAYVRG